MSVLKMGKVSRALIMRAGTILGGLGGRGGDKKLISLMAT